MTAPKQHTNREFFDFFRSRLSDLSAETASKYSRTISDLDCFLTGHRLSLSDLSPVIVADWATELFRQGLAVNTVARHLNILSALIKSASKKEMLPPDESPRQLAKLLSESQHSSGSLVSKHPGSPVSKTPQFSGQKKFSGSLVEKNSGSLVSKHPGSLVSKHPGSLVSETPQISGQKKFSGSLVSKHPGSLVSKIPGSLVSKHPGSLVVKNTTFIPVLREILKKQSDFDVYEDLLLFSLVNGALPVEEVAMIKKGDAAIYNNEVSRLIIARNQSPRREYVFDLRQSYATPRQIRSAIAEGLKPLLAKIGIPADADPDEAVRSLWAACAIQSGATASEALGRLQGPAPYSLPEFCIPANDIPDIRLWDNAVHSMIAHELPVWYAMHLRKGVDFDDLRKKIADCVRPVPELFYPSETVRRRVGNKTVFEEHPFISRTAFFKSRQENILPMFALIGDKAWCYRVTNTPGAPYAAISSRDMQRFQAAIGVFTPDIEIHPLGELTPRPGESVIIIKAGFDNREGEVEEVISDGATTLFRIKLSTDQGYEWRMDLDARQIQPIK